MDKRANGEGTVYQRKDGRWVATISLDNGQRKYYYFATQKEAVKAIREAQAVTRLNSLFTTSASRQ